MNALRASVPFDSSRPLNKGKFRRASVIKILYPDIATAAGDLHRDHPYYNEHQQAIVSVSCVRCSAASAAAPLELVIIPSPWNNGVRINHAR